MFFQIFTDYKCYKIDTSISLSVKVGFYSKHIAILDSACDLFNVIATHWDS